MPKPVGAGTVSGPWAGRGHSGPAGGWGPKPALRGGLGDGTEKAPSPNWHHPSLCHTTRCVLMAVICPTEASVSQRSEDRTSRKPGPLSAGRRGTRGSGQPYRQACSSSSLAPGSLFFVVFRSFLSFLERG